MQSCLLSRVGGTGSLDRLRSTPIFVLRACAHVGHTDAPFMAAGSIIFAAPLVMTMAVVAAASATHHVNLTLNDATVIVRVGGGTTAGVFSGSPFGSGAIVQRIRVTSASGPTVKTQSTITIFTTKGRLTGRGGSTRTTHPDGSMSIIATRSITGGTGAYRDAAGHLITMMIRSDQGYDERFASPFPAGEAGDHQRRTTRKLLNTEAAKYRTGCWSRAPVDVVAMIRKAGPRDGSLRRCGTGYFLACSK